jgi:hypothetical protein
MGHREQDAEKMQPLDLLQGDVLVLATWNTGGIEGQLNSHMEQLKCGSDVSEHWSEFV